MAYQRGEVKMKPENDDNQSHANKISKIFNYVGGTLIFFGITYLIFNNWFVLANVCRILVTLGVAVWALMFAAALSRQGKSPATSAVFYIIGGLLLPLGLSVTLNAIGLNLNYDLENILITGLCFCVFLLLELSFPREVLLLFCILFGSMFFFSGTNYLNNIYEFLPLDTLSDYQVMALGVGFLVVGRAIAKKNDSDLTGILYLIGGFLILAASFDLGGLLYENRTYVFWEIVSPILVILSFIFSIPLQSKALLYLGSIFLIIYIYSLTHKFAYLFGSLGWPVVLIAAGVFLMLLGYLIVNVQKHFPKK
jgi:hypothetical protein